MTPSTSTNDTGQVIRITAEDARSSHVDDLLKRHASLRGEQGITRDRGRKWYYQNWFVFMIAGTVAALLAYAIINPFFDELNYIQGTVTSIDALPSHTIKFAEMDKGQPQEVQLTPEQFIEAKVGDHTVAFANFTRWRGPDGKYGEFKMPDLHEGQTIGAYVMYTPGPHDEERSLARYVVPDPKPRSASDIPLKDMARRKFVANLLIFPLIAAFVGLFIGAADGIMCRLLRRVLLAGAVGLVFGFVGGFLSGDVLAELVYTPLSLFAAKQGGTLGFSLQTAGRALAWALAGMTMGLGQGLALRSKRLLLYGFLGGLIGGLLGGLLFDPIDLILLGGDKPSASVSRWVGFAVIGAVVGLMIGIVERLARDAWLRMVEGPLAGKEFLVFKDVMRMGASPKSEIYLFNDPAIAASHATIRATGDIYEIENTCRENPVRLNGRPVQRSRLRHGDRISLGRTSFVFQRQRAE
jgi:hypothetical protein